MRLQSYHSQYFSFAPQTPTGADRSVSACPVLNLLSIVSLFVLCFCALSRDSQFIETNWILCTVHDNALHKYTGPLEQKLWGNPREVEGLHTQNAGNNFPSHSGSKGLILAFKQRGSTEAVHSQAAADSLACVWSQMGNQEHGYYVVSAHLCSPSVTSHSHCSSIPTPVLASLFWFSFGT